MLEEWFNMILLSTLVYLAFIVVPSYPLLKGQK